MMITLMPHAVSKLQELFAEEAKPDLVLRVFVQGGGCSGFQYGFTWDTEESDDDFSFSVNDNIHLIVDAMSMQYLTGSVIKFKKEISGSNFVIENPNSSNKCGCGSSFAV
jgi:iron-sulfur cluster insertion protein